MGFSYKTFTACRDKFYPLQCKNSGSACAGAPPILEHEFIQDSLYLV